MTGVDDPVTWLRQQLDARMAQLDEDERVARAATVGPWRWGPSLGKISWLLEGPRVPFGGMVLGVSDAGCPSTHDGEHIARWDPQRTLEEVKLGRAEVEAKRRILSWCEARLHDAEDFPDDAEMQLRAVEVRRLHLPWLAMPFAGRPGFREEWRVAPPA